jgi:hypothetical protein
VLLGPEATPVPGAAATLTRSINTPIPTPVRTPSAVAAVSPSPSRVAVPVAPSPSAVAVSDQAGLSDLSEVQNRLEQVLSSPDLNGLEPLLLDHVSLSTPQGGSVMDAAQAAAWLRDHAGPGIKVSQVNSAAQELMVQVQTEGWPIRDPLETGQVTFSLRRYDANGRQDDSGGGDWKIDVIEAE